MGIRESRHPTTIVLGGWVVRHRLQHDAISYPLTLFFIATSFIPRHRWQPAEQENRSRFTPRRGSILYPICAIEPGASLSSPTGPISNNIQYRSHCGRSTSLHYIESVHDLTDAVTSCRMSWNVSTTRYYGVQTLVNCDDIRPGCIFVDAQVARYGTVLHRRDIITYSLSPFYISLLSPTTLNVRFHILAILTNVFTFGSCDSDCSARLCNSIYSSNFEGMMWTMIGVQRDWTTAEPGGLHRFTGTRNVASSWFPC
jgi:hypothetical protein